MFKEEYFIFHKTKGGNKQNSAIKTGTHCWKSKQNKTVL